MHFCWSDKVMWQSYVSLSLVIIIRNYEKFVWQFLHVRSYHSSTKATVAWWSQKSQTFYEVTSNVTIICQNDNLSLSLTWLDCFQIDSGFFILFAEINQILLKIYFIHNLWTFMYVLTNCISLIFLVVPNLLWPFC